MNLFINGKEETCADGATVLQLLEARNQPPQTVAVAHNETFVPRSTYADVVLSDGDHVEIVAPMQGG